MRLNSKYIRWILLLFFSAFIVWLFTYNLTYFSATVFDEEFYVTAASFMYRGYVDPNFVHPPLSKLLISLPMYWLGDNWSLSWRLMPVMFGLAGLYLFYTFARRLQFTTVEACILVLGLIATKSYYTISRTAMLDIFLVFFILLSAYFLYTYFNIRSFSRDLKAYTFDKWYILSALTLGLASCCKWTGFFPLIFWLMYWVFYVQGAFIQKARLLIYFGSIVGLVYIFLSWAILHFDFSEVMFRNYISVVFHNSAMLPENNHRNPVDGGGMALVRFFFRYDQFIIKVPFFTSYGLSNNYFMPLFFLAFSLIQILSGVGYLIRIAQKVPVSLPGVFTDSRMQFMYWYSFFLIMTWGLIAREQYLYYYLPAFPFILLFTGRYLLDYCSPRLRLFVVVSYFCFFFYNFQLVLPLY